MLTSVSSPCDAALARGAQTKQAVAAAAAPAAAATIHDLPLEILLAVFSLLDPTTIAAGVAGVCRHWRRASLEGTLWKRFFEARWPHLEVEPMESQWKTLYKEMHLILRDEVKTVTVVPLEASSKDHDQDIQFTVLPQYFWSSAPNPSPDSDEYLLYRFARPHCIVTRAEIMPMRNRVAYGPRAASVQVGYQRSALDGHKSRNVDTPNEEDWVPVDVSDQDLQVGNFIRLHLHGKYATHSAHDWRSHYYTCLTNVRFQGIPIERIPFPSLRNALQAAAARHGTEISSEEEKIEEPEFDAETLTAMEEAQMNRTLGRFILYRLLSMVAESD